MTGARQLVPQEPGPRIDFSEQVPVGGAGQVVAHRDEDQEGEPDDARDHGEADQFALVLHVHEEEDHERRLGAGDAEGDMSRGCATGSGARGQRLRDAREALREELIKLVDPTMDRRLRVSGGERPPGVVLVVGVNGVGKTTTVGKSRRILVAEDRRSCSALPTPSAPPPSSSWPPGASGSASTWSAAPRAPTRPRRLRGGRRASTSGVDTVIVDTAGRLQNKAGLMDELGKVKRVIEKQAPVTEVLLVLDATTGQNGLIQARVFAEVVDVTGIVLTKLDGTAKGGIVVAVQRELGVPVKLVGLGEGPDDLAPFDAEAFVDALLG